MSNKKKPPPFDPDKEAREWMLTHDAKYDSAYAFYSKVVNPRAMLGDQRANNYLLEATIQGLSKALRAVAHGKPMDVLASDGTRTKTSRKRSRTSKLPKGTSTQLVLWVDMTIDQAKAEVNEMASKAKRQTTRVSRFGELFELFESMPGDTVMRDACEKMGIDFEEFMAGSSG